MSRQRSLLVAAAVVALTSATALQPAAAAAGRGASSSYIVTVRGVAASTVAGLARGLGGSVTHVYGDALQGFAVRLPAVGAAALRALPGVVAVEPDRVLRVRAAQINPPSYGLDRIDQRQLPLSHSYRTRGTGAGVDAYVIDTGIRLSHRDLAGRAVTGIDVVDGGAATDCNGHGTHVAGTLGGRIYGVAKSVRLIAVRVLDCGGSGETSAVIAGVDWMTRNHVAGRPAVANLSLGGGASEALDAAVRGAVADGITVAVAGGNDGNALLGGLTGTSDACNASPSRVRAALTAGASDASDTRAPYSDIGSCIDLFAPGTDIVSDWATSDTATQVLSGTSMATPHVAGVAAVYLSLVPRATPAQVAQRLVSTATPGVVQDAGAGSPNRLLFTS